jgi:hypothetical protein
MIETIEAELSSGGTLHARTDHPRYILNVCIVCLTVPFRAITTARRCARTVLLAYYERTE